MWPSILLSALCYEAIVICKTALINEALRKERGTGMQEAGFKVLVLCLG